MEKYPSIKFTIEAWERILPIVKEWGCALDWGSNKIKDARMIVSNYGDIHSDCLKIGYTYNSNIGDKRYLVDSVDEFLSAVAKLAGKVYYSSNFSTSSIMLKKTGKVTLNFNI